jgi:hypothetical protein
LAPPAPSEATSQKQGSDVTGKWNLEIAHRDSRNGGTEVAAVFVGGGGRGGEATGRW